MRDFSLFPCLRLFAVPCSRYSLFLNNWAEVISWRCNGSNKEVICRYVDNFSLYRNSIVTYFYPLSMVHHSGKKLITFMHANFLYDIKLFFVRHKFFSIIATIFIYNMNFFCQHAFLFCATLNIFSQHESLFGSHTIFCWHNWRFFCDSHKFGGQRNLYVNFFFFFFWQNIVFCVTRTKCELKEYHE